MNRLVLGPRPDPLPWKVRVVSFCLRAPLFFLATAFFGSLSLIASLWDKSGKLQHRIAQRWGRAVTRISGAKVTVLNGQYLDGRVAVYAANHLSYADTPVLFASLPFQFRIVARHDLFKLPFIGWHLTRSGQVPVNVTNPRASISSLSSAVKTLKSGMPVFIFPEGGRTESGHPEDFLNGPAFMAIRAGVPIVPMALIGTHELLPIHAAEFYPVPVTLAVGEPIETEQYTIRQTDELTERIRRTISDLYYEHSYLSPDERAGMPANFPAEPEKTEKTPMKQPRIAIPEPTSRDVVYNDRSWRQYAEAVEKSGGIAVKIPLSATQSEAAQLVASCEGVLLPGSGADVNPEKYGQEPIHECNPADPAREAVDELLMQDAANLHKPLFGICYGFQAWNVWRGGALIQDLKTGVNHRPGRDVREAHRVNVSEGTKIEAITGEKDLTVNSSHHQGVARPGDGLAVVARSVDDGLIEAVEGTEDQFVVAVQWHPERSFDYDAASKALFAAFVKAAAEWQPRVIRESVAP